MRVRIIKVDRNGHYLFAACEEQGRHIFVHASEFPDGSVRGLAVGEQIEIADVKGDSQGRGPRGYGARRLNDDEQAEPGQRLRGKVRGLWKDRGFGFVSVEPRGDYFLHETSLNNYQFRDLMVGDQVEFTVIRSDKGDRAHDVEVVALVEA